MTHILQSEHFRNDGDNATVTVERFSDLHEWGWSVPMWRILLRRDGSALSDVISTNLKNKPSKNYVRRRVH